MPAIIWKRVCHVQTVLRLSLDEPRSKSQLAAKQIEFITNRFPLLIYTKNEMNLCREDYTQVDYVYRLIVPKGSASLLSKTVILRFGKGSIRCRNGFL
ncbi:hypothetical protein PO124_13660 [Bacillus licheniformis]|nr:hypothetical protein [Bacillus licheniformis]